MAELRRLQSYIPEANVDFEMFETPGAYIMALIAANTSDTIETKISAWILPYENTPIPSGEDEENYRIYIIKNGIVPPAGSYETWRFSMVNGDTLWVKSNNGRATFTVQGINQSV